MGSHVLVSLISLDHIREKDGIWAVLAWLSVLAYKTRTTLMVKSWLLWKTLLSSTGPVMVAIVIHDTTISYNDGKATVHIFRIGLKCHHAAWHRAEHTVAQCWLHSSTFQV